MRYANGGRSNGEAFQMHQVLVMGYTTLILHTNLDDNRFNLVCFSNNVIVVIVAVAVTLVWADVAFRDLRLFYDGLQHLKENS